MRRLLVLLTLSVALAAGAVVAEAATRTVSWKIGSIKTLTIKRNDIVKWVWADSKPHDVRGPGLRTSIKTRSRASKRFTRRGTFRYICTVHSNMRTKVVVR